MFIRVWDFVPHKAHVEAFVDVYGPDGTWAALFRTAAGFLSTELLPSVTQPDRFLTLDRWRDAASWEAFRSDRAHEYLALDRQCNTLVETERELGILRRARLDDASQMAELAGELGYPTEPDDMRSRLEIVGAQENELVLVAEGVGGAVVGWVHVFGAQRLESPPYAEIGGLVVAERARGTGFGHALLAATESWARDRGFGDMRIRSNVLRARAHRFYERCGYESPKSQKVLIKPLR